MKKSSIWQQPKGMYVVGFAEIFERLSYYTFAFLLVLFASASVEKGGLGWTQASAIQLTGYYALGSYAFPLLGGFIADRFVGAYHASIFGAILIILGHFAMFFVSSQALALFYIALVLVALGTGFFKPCMPALLGKLYHPTDNLRRESGFSFYYMGINIGAMIAGVSGGLLLAEYGFRIALASAGVGMIFGLAVFVLGKKHLVIESKMPWSMRKEAVDQKTIHEPLTPMGRRALKYLLISFLFFAVWTLVYSISLSGTLSVYIENYTNRDFFSFKIPTPFFISLESLGILISTPILAYIYSIYARKNKPVHFFTQMNIAVLLGALAVCYLTYLAFQIAGVTEGQSLEQSQGLILFQHYQFAIYVLVIALSEVMISPVMMAAISLLSPKNFSTLFQSFYLLTFGVTGLLAGWIGAHSLKFPVETFGTVAGGGLLAALGFAYMRQKMIHVAMDAAHEQRNRVSTK